MKKIILSLVMMAVAVTAAAQTVGDKMFVYYGGRVSDGFIPSEIDSIVYSNYDNDSIWYDDVVTQVIYTPDSVYRFPLAQIDSISFVRPATIYKPYAIVLEGEIRQYITSTDGFNLTMASNTPSRFLPKVGDRLVTMKPDDRFPYYFAGEVISATPSDDGIFLTCDTLEFEDVVEQFADIVCVGNLEEEPEQAPRTIASAKRVSTPWIYLDLPSFKDSKEFDISIIPIPELKENFDVGISFGAGTSYSIEPKANCKFTWFIQGGLYINGLVVIDNSFTNSNHIAGGVEGNYEKTFLKKPIQGLIRYTPFGWYIDVGWFLNVSGSIVAETSVNKKTRTTLSFIYDRAHPENNMAKRMTRALSDSSNPGKFYGDVTAEIGLYLEFGVSLLRKELVKVGCRTAVGIKGESNSCLWIGINNANKSFDYYNKIKDCGLTISTFSRIGGVWNVLEPLPFSISGDFLKRTYSFGELASFNLVPSFDNVNAKRIGNSTTINAKADLGQNVLMPVTVGFTAINSNGERVSTKYMSQTYSLFNQFPTASVELKNVPNNGKHYVCPILKLFGHEIMASPSCEVDKADLPVKITDFKQTNSQYKKDGFTHEGESYDYRYDVAVTVSIEDLEGVADWGYVYRDPNGKDKEISLLSHGTSYTDNSYAYFRNTSPATVTLFGYVKYVGSDKPVYGKPTDYEVRHSETSCPDSNHPHMIDLGLPSGTKWACCNVGAHSPEQYGGYYAWGEVSEKAVYDGNTYQYYNDNTGYINLGSDIAGTQYDVAHVQWGGSWVMPSHNQQVELLDNCSSVWTTENGVYGRRFTGPNGGSIFLPAAGDRWGGGLYGAGEDGWYWSSTPHPYDSIGAYNLYFYSGNAYWVDYRYYGRSVRPVARN